MKILYINGSRIPTEKAHGVQIMEMCGAFAMSNVELELWIPRRLNYIRQDPFDYYGVERNFKIRKIPCIDFVVFDKLLGPLVFWLTELNFLFFVFIYLAVAPRFGRREAREDKIIYTRDKFVLFFLSLFKQDIFFEAHTVPARIFFNGIKRAKRVIAITYQLKNIFIERGVEPNKILVAADGVNLEEFDVLGSKEECRRKFGLPMDKKLVLYTGHLYPWKGADALLEVARKFSTSNTIFVLVGGTPGDIESYKLKVKSYQLKNVYIIGHRPHREVPYWLKAADVLVLPNSGKYDISKYWTSPLKLFEYMAAARPIVARDLPSIREILNENNAILVEEDEAQALATGISIALQDQERAARLAEQARLDAAQYTWKKRAESIINFIYKQPNL